jgi:hypothetical protein
MQHIDYQGFNKFNNSEMAAVGNTGKGAGNKIVKQPLGCYRAIGQVKTALKSFSQKSHLFD